MTDIVVSIMNSPLAQLIARCILAVIPVLVAGLNELFGIQITL